MITHTIEPGEVRISAVTQVVSAADVAVFEIDMLTKYAEVLYVATSDEEVTVALHTTPATLHADESRRGTPTRVVFTVPGPDWLCVSDSHTRYALVVALYRHSGESEEPDL